MRRRVSTRIASTPVAELSFLSLCVASTSLRIARTIPGYHRPPAWKIHMAQPFVGSLFYITYHFHRFHDMIADLAQQFGDGVTWSSGILGNPPFVYIGADPAIVEHVLKTAFWSVADTSCGATAALGISDSTNLCSVLLSSL